MVGNGGGILSEFGKCFKVDVGIGGMDCAGSSLDSKDRFSEHVIRLNNATTRAIWLWPWLSN
jgi:hypothetical protein